MDYVHISRILHDVMSAIAYIFKDTFTLEIYRLLEQYSSITLIPFDIIFELFQTLCQTIYAFSELLKKEFTVNYALSYLIMMLENSRYLKSN